MYLEQDIMVSPGASIRGDEGQPIKVCNYSDLQDGVVLHGLETELDGNSVENRQYNADGNIVLFDILLNPSDHYSAKPRSIVVLLGR